MSDQKSTLLVALACIGPFVGLAGGIVGSGTGLFQWGRESATAAAEVRAEIREGDGALDRRLAKAENWISDFSDDRIQRRAEYVAALAKLDTRVGESEKDTRAANNQARENAIAIAGLRSDGLRFQGSIDKLTDATIQLSLKLEKIGTTVDRIDQAINGDQMPPIIGSRSR